MGNHGKDMMDAANAGAAWKERQQENLAITAEIPAGTTLIPQHGLRYAMKDVPIPGYEGATRREPVLQQRYTTTGGKEVWLDVPVVVEGENGQ